MAIPKYALIAGKLWVAPIVQYAARIMLLVVFTLTDGGMLIAALQSSQGNYRYNKTIAYGT